MKTRPIPLIATILAAATLPVFAQDEPKPRPPTPPTSPEKADRPPEPNRPPGFPGRNGPRDERAEGRGEGRRDNPRGPEEGRRSEDGPRRDGDRKPEDGPRREGDRKPEGHERGWNIPLPPHVPTPFIGIVTSQPAPDLRAQLGLKDGFGLVVGEILPDSPAAKAGLKQYDVLTKFNDQQLVDAGQLSTLVRAAGKDTEATLTLMRAAKEQTLPVKIGERMAPRRMPFLEGFDMRAPFNEKFRLPFQDNTKQKQMQERMQDRMKEYGEKMREYQERMKMWQKNPRAEMPQPPPLPDSELTGPGAPLDPADVLVQALPGGSRQIHVFQPGVNSAVSYSTGDAKVMMKDTDGSIEMRTKDGKRTLLAKDLQGAVIFDGPIDTEEQRSALPAEIRKKLENIEVRTIVQTSGAAFVPPGPVDGDEVQ